MMKRTRITAAAAVSIMIFALLAGCSGGQKKTEPAETAAEATETAAAEATETAAAEATETAAAEPAETAAPEAEETAASGTEEYLSCPRIGADDFPKLDGSTATLPISQAIYRLATGASQTEAEQVISHNKTSRSYLNLAQLKDPNAYSYGKESEEPPDLVIAYEPGEEVRSLLKDAGDPLDIRPIGRDALVFLVNDSNPVQSVTASQIVDIYGGDITNWSDVGGRDEKIEAFQRNKNSGSQNLMDSLVMKGRPMAEAPEAYYEGDMAELVSSIAGYDNSGNALGYSVYYYVQNMYVLPGIRLLGIDGVVPDTDSIREGRYPYVNDFYAAVRKDEPHDSPAYLLFEWLTSDDGQSLVNGLGYVGVTGASRSLPEALTQEEQEYGQIPLPEGTLIACNMGSGVGFFDGRMRLVHFVGNVGTEDEFYYGYYRHMESSEYRTDRLTPLWSNGAHDETGYGLYSLKDKKWAYPPPCGNLIQRKNGYLLTRAGENGEAICVDWEGNILMSGDTVADMARGFDDDMNHVEDPMGYPGFLWGNSFAEMYPEIAEKYDGATIVGMTDGEIDAKCVAVVTEKTVYYYDYEGRLMATADIPDHVDRDADRYDSSSLFWYLRRHMPIRIDEELAKVNVWDPDSDMRRLELYRNGILEWSLDGKPGEYLDADSHYYTIEREDSDYTYFYNYDGELCGKIAGMDE